MCLGLWIIGQDRRFYINFKALDPVYDGGDH